MGKLKLKNGLSIISTFSIVGVDIATGEMGVAVQSKFLAVGAAVPWAKAEVGAIATQSLANTSYGPRGLALLKEGMEPARVLQELLNDDPGRDDRQVGMVDAYGRSATYTGKGCFDYAGGIAGDGFACQGNILAGEAVVKNMASVFQNTVAPLPERLLLALAAGQEAGGDRRGMQSAALYVVQQGGGYGGFNDHYVDLRVDDHVDPIQELNRLLVLQRLYFGRTKPEDRLPLQSELLNEVTGYLKEAGYLVQEQLLNSSTLYSEPIQKALKAYFMTENFDDRWTDEAIIDQEVLQFMRRQFS